VSAIELDESRRKRRVLVVEDDQDIRSVVREVCQQQGYEVVEAERGKEGLEASNQHDPDLILLDWVLPDISGIEVCRELRHAGSICPIVMLTARASTVDKVVGLEVGADDYITKPFDARELAARLGAHLRRSLRAPASRSGEGVVNLGGVEIDTEGRRVRVSGREVRLTMTEFNLLSLLAANSGRVLSRAQLLEKVWGYLSDVDYHSVDPHIQRLRKKLGSLTEARVTLEAVPGLGYRLSSSD
jgi:DNA-binding response OmpR family regulator